MALSSITVLLFGIVFTYNLLPAKLRPLSMEGLVTFIHSIANTISGIFFWLFLIHLWILTIRSFSGKHSIVWLISRQALQLFTPLFMVVLISFLNGDPFEGMSSIIIGVASGVISSLIVLFWNRDEQLIKSVLSRIAPDLLKDDEKTLKQD